MNNTNTNDKTFLIILGIVCMCCMLFTLAASVALVVISTKEDDESSSPSPSSPSPSSSPSSSSPSPSSPSSSSSSPSSSSLSTRVCSFNNLELSDDISGSYNVWWEKINGDKKNEIKGRCRSKTDSCTSNDKFFKTNDFDYINETCRGGFSGEAVACRFRNDLYTKIYSKTEDNVINTEYKDICKD